MEEAGRQAGRHEGRKTRRQTEEKSGQKMFTGTELEAELRMLAVRFYAKWRQGDKSC